MASCDVQALISENPCLSTLTIPWLEVVITQELCELYNFLSTGEPVTCDIQEIMDDAKCLYTLMPQQLKVVQAQLLCNILQVISGGSSAIGFLCGAVDPEGAVIGLVCGQTYTNTTTGTLFKFTGTIGTSTGWV